MPWQVYVFILDRLKGKRNRKKNNVIRNELRDTIAADGRFDDQIAAWIADGSIESRWYVGQENAYRNNFGQLPICYLPFKARRKGDIHYFKDEKERIIYSQHSVMYMLTDGTDVDTSGYEAI